MWVWTRGKSRTEAHSSAYLFLKTALACSSLLNHCGLDRIVNQGELSNDYHLNKLASAGKSSEVVNIHQHKYIYGAALLLSAR